MRVTLIISDCDPCMNSGPGCGDPCMDQPCLNDGTCQDNGDGTRTCLCHSNYIGQDCQSCKLSLLLRIHVVERDDEK